MISPNKIIKTISDSPEFLFFSPNAPKKNFFMLRNFLKRKGDGKNSMTSERKTDEKNKEIFKKLNFTQVSNFSHIKDNKHLNLNTDEEIRDASVKEAKKKKSDDNDDEEMAKRSFSVPSIYTVPFSKNRIRDFMMKDINEERKKLKNDITISKSKTKLTQHMKLEKILFKDNSSLKKINKTDDLIIQNDGTITKYEKDSDANKGNNNNNEMIKTSIKINELMFLPLKYQSSFWKINK